MGGKMDQKKNEKGQDICYCEKGIIPKDNPRTKYRCPQCGKTVWPKEMGSGTEPKG
jgi:predicted RNA-binding Zn-ribbon protein involved in translation (DUF1610 family)